MLSTAKSKIDTASQKLKPLVIHCFNIVMKKLPSTLDRERSGTTSMALDL